MMYVVVAHMRSCLDVLRQVMFYVFFTFLTANTNLHLFRHAASLFLSRQPSLITARPHSGTRPYGTLRWP